MVKASEKRLVGGFAAALALACVLACVTMPQRRVAMVQDFPQSDLDMLKVMESMAPKPSKTQMAAQMAAPVKGEKKRGLTMQQQYARIMQNQVPLSRFRVQRGW